MTVTIESAVELDATSKKEIESTVSKHVKVATDFVYKVDESILGGLRVSLGSKRIDFSLKGKLDTLKKAIS